MSLPERRIYRPDLDFAVRRCKAHRSDFPFAENKILLWTSPHQTASRPRSFCLQVFAKLAVLIQHKLGQPEQLAKALQLLLHLQRISKSALQQAALYSLLVEILRAGSSEHGIVVVQTTLEIVAVTLRRNTLSCGPLVDLGVVT